MTQAKLAWELLIKSVGHYHGKGVNHEKQNFSHNFSMDLLSSSKTLEVSAIAVGETGEVYHAEKSWIGFDLSGALVLYVTSNNHPGITPHAFHRIEEKNNCKNVVFRFGNPDDRNSFREEITFSVFSDGNLAHQYSWGLPGGEFEPRSSAEVKVKNLDAINLNHIHLAVKNIKASTEFYSQHFGFRHRVDHGSCVFMTNNDGFDLALDPAIEPVAFPKWFHIGCRLKSSDDVKALFEKINQKNPVQIRKPLEIYDDFVFFRCVDPDGYEIEVYWE